MLAAQANEEITIQKRSRTKGSYGQLVETVDNLVTTFAKVTFKNTNERFNGDVNFDFDNAVFTIRHRDDIDYDCQILYDTDTYDIISIQKMKRRGDIIMIGKLQRDGSK